MLGLVALSNCLTSDSLYLRCPPSVLIEVSFPAFEGIGLGKALTTTGLNYLRYQGIENGILYVDEENFAALNLYKSLGFKQSGKDCLFKYKNPQ